MIPILPKSFPPRAMLHSEKEGILRYHFVQGVSRYAVGWNKRSREPSPYSSALQTQTGSYVKNLQNTSPLKAEVPKRRDRSQSRFTRHPVYAARCVHSFRCKCTMHGSRDRGGSGVARSMAQGPLAEGVHGVLRWMWPPPPAFVQLHGDAETWMHPVGEYNELEPDSPVDGSWFRLALSNDPPLSCHPLSRSFSHSVYLSLSLALPLPLFPLVHSRSIYSPAVA